MENWCKSFILNFYWPVFTYATFLVQGWRAPQRTLSQGFFNFVLWNWNLKHLDTTRFVGFALYFCLILKWFVFENSINFLRIYLSPSLSVSIIVIQFVSLAPPESQRFGLGVYFGVYLEIGSVVCCFVSLPIDRQTNLKTIFPILNSPLLEMENELSLSLFLQSQRTQSVNLSVRIDRRERLTSSKQ